jgi:hypothetical protein
LIFEKKGEGVKIMRRMEEFYKLPRIIYPVIAGYKGLKGGLAIGWLGKFVYILKPINERR